ncbi:MAG: hypothetical protein ABIQ86_13470 [Steroidobacteraceae bacterium]
MQIHEVVEASHFKKMLMMIGRRRPQDAGDVCIVIAAASGNLIDALTAKEWFGGFRQVVGFVTDSYWTEEIPLEVRRNRIFDHIFITSEEDLPEWRRKVGTRISCLPWGSDALDLGSATTQRTWDILRVGRQPPEWDDDERNQSAAASLALSYHPRPSGSDDWRENQALVMRAYASSKFLLAFSNRVHRSEHTHPSREYLTGRWTDALACGAIVAGIPPRAPSIDALLWPEALLDLGTTNLRDGMAVIRDAASRWSPGLATLNHLRALEKLDWRWRLSDMADTIGLKSNRLDAEMNRLRARISEMKLLISQASPARD